MESPAVTDAHPILTFGVFADTQYADKPIWKGRYYADADRLLAECIEDFNSLDLDFVVQLGDLIDGDNDARGQLEHLLPILGRCRHRLFHVVGNHDFHGFSRRDFIQTLGMDQPYYDFTVNNVRFVVLDGMDCSVSGGWDPQTRHYQDGLRMLRLLKRQRAENARLWNGGIGTEQTAWLTGVLEHAGSLGQHVVIFGHLPLMPPEEKHIVYNAGDIRRLLNRYPNVIAYFAGHRHDGGIHRDATVEYITLEAMVEAPGANAYAVVRLWADRLQMQGIGRVSDHEMSLCVSKP